MPPEVPPPMPDIVDPAVEAYAEAHTTPPDAPLQAIAEWTRANLAGPGMMVGPLEGRFLEFLVFALQPAHVLEIGTFSGYSALSMARALPPAATWPTARTPRGSRSARDPPSTRSRRCPDPSTWCSSTPTRRTTSPTTRPCCPSSPPGG